MHHMWSQIVLKEYEFDKSEVRSAVLLLEKGQSAGNVSMYWTEPVPMDKISSLQGFTVLAWALPDILIKWAGRV